jgi:hypothetical protein
MAVSEATLLAKISALEARVTALAAKVKTDETNLSAVLGMSSGQLSALATLSAAQLNAMNTVTATQYDLLGTTNISFVASLSKLSHQTSSNSTITTGAGSLSNGDRVIINDAINALNNLQSGLQSNNFES